MNTISHDNPLSRRCLLKNSAVGFGYLALQSLLKQQEARADSNLISPLTPTPFHHTPRAKRVIFLFMKGGPSAVDTFDYKEELQKHHGQPFPGDKPRVQFAPTGNLLASPWKFRHYGESGKLVSDLFPNTAQCVDDICFLHSVYGTNPAHGGALLKLHTGSDNFVRPSMGAWVNYGLGSENENLPGFITICPTIAHGGMKNWGSAFLPAKHQGVPLGNTSLPSTEARVKHIRNTKWTSDIQRAQIDLMREINQNHLEHSGPEASLDARIHSYELAFRMQNEMPLAQDLTEETSDTFSMYGMDNPVTENFGRQCLMARRFAERGVRFIQVTHGDTKIQWDHHHSLKEGHAEKASEVDKPISGLLRDLKQRGLLDDTLVMWGGEFGRTPTCEGGADDGRDHNPEGFTMWMAGGGVKGGYSHGATDPFGYYSLENKMHVHDLHATLLHLLGLNHEKLTYRYAGRDFRLTDVEGHVHSEIFA